MAKNFSLSELVDLKNKYIQNKIYVACNPVFGKLDQFIKNLYQQKKWYILSENRIIFRTRTAAIGKLLAKEELWEPPYGVSSHGRYNDIGASVLYCANNKDVVPMQQQNINFKQQYIISNVVSAICLKIGYDGIVYRSTKDDVSIDYALFDKYVKGKDIEILSVDI